jgi:hypothetical protein
MIERTEQNFDIKPAWLAGSMGLIKYHRSHGLVPRDIEYHLSFMRRQVGSTAQPGCPAAAPGVASAFVRRSRR